jgi:hypothetical protein
MKSSSDYGQGGKMSVCFVRGGDYVKKRSVAHIEQRRISFFVPPLDSARDYREKVKIILTTISLDLEMGSPVKKLQRLVLKRILGKPQTGNNLNIFCWNSSLCRPCSFTY